ncbi:hypothetical protein FOZ60_016746 [Perkinsus olseni]|uniref:Uncharacterized protein n=1 Tax=Perkinsus olseni TaxID=32597 RepID=A0A7J6N3J8_PEROL|nr:hypothetical protein FOZ60_016746 [Perkinsus olseni]
MRCISFIAVLSLAASLGEDEGEQCMATYARKRYWEDDDPTFIKFFKGTILHTKNLAKFIEDFRWASKNHATVYLYYQGGAQGVEAVSATNFVFVFESFVRKFATEKMGPLGISFDVML